MIKIVNQNILDIEVDIIIQSNNCFNTQGAGVAKAIRGKYPEVYLADLKTIKGDENKLGKILPVKLHTDKPSYCFLNYNQYGYGREARYVNYEYFYKCLEKVRDKTLLLGLNTIAAPFGMSCQNAGGDFSIIEALINSIFEKRTDLEFFICKV